MNFYDYSSKHRVLNYISIHVLHSMILPNNAYQLMENFKTFLQRSNSSSGCNKLPLEPSTTYIRFVPIKRFQKSIHVLVPCFCLNGKRAAPKKLAWCSQLKKRRQNSALICMLIEVKRKFCLLMHFPKMSRQIIIFHVASTIRSRINMPP